MFVVVMKMVSIMKKKANSSHLATSSALLCLILIVVYNVRAVRPTAASATDIPLRPWRDKALLVVLPLVGLEPEGEVVVGLAELLLLDVALAALVVILCEQTS